MMATEPRKEIARWVIGQIRDQNVSERFLDTVNYWTLGFFAPDGTIQGGIVYHTKRGDSIEAVAAGAGNWLTPMRTRAIFEVAFNALGCELMIVHVAKRNKRSRRFVEKLGFTLRGTIPKAIKGKDGVIYSLHRDECRWIEGKQDG